MGFNDAHPPCTYLSVSGLHWNARDKERALKTESALEFVQKIMDSNIERIIGRKPSELHKQQNKETRTNH